MAVTLGEAPRVPFAIRTVMAESKEDPDALLAILRAAAMLRRTKRIDAPTERFAGDVPDAVQSIEGTRAFNRIINLLMDADDEAATTWVIEEGLRIGRRLGLSAYCIHATLMGEALGTDVMRSAEVRSRHGMPLLEPLPNRSRDTRIHANRLMLAVIHPDVTKFVMATMINVADGASGVREIVRRATDAGIITVPSDIDAVSAGIHRIRSCVEAWMVSRGAIHDFTGWEASLTGWSEPMPASCLAPPGCRYLHMAGAAPRGWEGAFLMGRDVALTGYVARASDVTGTALLLPVMPASGNGDEVGATLRMVCSTIPVQFHDHDDARTAARRALGGDAVDHMPGASLRTFEEMVATTMRAMAHIREG